MYPLNGTYESTGEVRPVKEGDLYLCSNLFAEQPRKVVRALPSKIPRVTPEVIMREITREDQNG